MNYSVTGEQLTSIADAIRAKALPTPLGKNLLNPDSLCAKLSAGTYTVSVKVKWDGTKTSPGSGASWAINGRWYAESFDDYSNPPSSGTITTETIQLTITKNVVVSLGLDSDLEITEKMIESGSSATTYEAYQPSLLEFPDDFISALQSMS